MSKTVIPDVYKRSYNCPRCGVLCPQQHYRVDKNRISHEEVEILVANIKHKTSMPRAIGGYTPEGVKNYRRDWDLVISICSECENYTVWENDAIIYPFTNDMPEPVENMPDDVKGIFEEAALVFKHSPRASAGLLRLAIEQLMVDHLEVKKGRIVDMIGELVKRGIPPHLQQGLDSLRFYGNKGMHLGEIDLEDNREKVEYLFKLINLMVQEMITKPKEIKEFYEELPESFREHIKKRDIVKK